MEDFTKIEDPFVELVIAYTSSKLLKTDAGLNGNYLQFLDLLDSLDIIFAQKGLLRSQTTKIITWLASMKDISQTVAHWYEEFQRLGKSDYEYKILTAMIYITGHKQRVQIQIRL